MDERLNEIRELLHTKFDDYTLACHQLPFVLHRIGLVVELSFYDNETYRGPNGILLICKDDAPDWQKLKTDLQQCVDEIALDPEAVLKSGLAKAFRAEELPDEPVDYAPTPEDDARRTAALEYSFGRFDAVSEKFRATFGFKLPKHVAVWDAFNRSLNRLESLGADRVGRQSSGYMFWFDEGGLESGSPSCGLNAKVFAKPEPPVCVRREPGIFAQKMIDHFGEVIPIEEEGRLLHATLRHHFLIRIFAFAELRALSEGVTAHKIESFHRRYKNILLLFDQNGMRSLGRIVGEHLEPLEKLARYEKEFRAALLKVPNRRSHRNVLEHMLGHFKTELGSSEKASFKTLLVDVDEHRAPVVAPLAIVKSWVERFDYDYLRDQVYLEPYPKALISMRDSGKGLEF